MSEPAFGGPQYKRLKVTYAAHRLISACHTVTHSFTGYGHLYFVCCQGQTSQIKMSTEMNLLQEIANLICYLARGVTGKPHRKELLGRPNFVAV